MIKKRKRSISKAIVAHELGHAVVAYAIDKLNKPLELVFEKNKNEALLSSTVFKVRDKKIIPKNKNLGRFLTPVDLGGLLGELLYDKRFAPWGVRNDVHTFLTANELSRSGLISELYEWFYLDTDKFSFYYTARIRNLNSANDLIEHSKNIVNYEHQADTVYRTAIAELFETNNPVEIIKLKEIYETLEGALDRCADVADVVEDIALKYGNG